MLDARARLGSWMLICLLAVVTLSCSDSTSPEEVVEVDASFTVEPPSGTVITDFQFDASGSSSTSRGLLFRWDWENDGVWDTDWSSSPVATHRYASGDTLTVALVASEASDSDTVTAQVTLDTRHGFVLDDIPVDDIEHPKGMTFDGTHFWVSDWGAPGTHRIYKVDPATGDTLSSFPAPSTWPGAVEWDGANLWVADYSGGPKLFKIDPADGSILDSFDVAYAANGGCAAWDGEAFYYGSYVSGTGEGDGLIHKYAVDGTELMSFQSPRGSEHPVGLAYDGENLWAAVAHVDTLYVLEPDDGDIVRTVPLSWGSAMVAANGYLWVGPGVIRQVVP